MDLLYHLYQKKYTDLAILAAIPSNNTLPFLRLIFWRASSRYAIDEIICSIRGFKLHDHRKDSCKPVGWKLKREGFINRSFDEKPPTFLNRSNRRLQIATAQ